MRDFLPTEIRRFIPLIALGFAAFCTVSAAVQMQKPIAAITKPQSQDPASPIQDMSTEADAQSESTPPAAEPVHKSLIRLLNDLDDILDAIHDADSFETAKPKLVSRAREQVALAAHHRNAGMTALSPFAQHELRPAIARHAKCLSRAVEIVPAVNKFFNDELGPILTH